MKYKNDLNFADLKNVPTHIAFIMDGNGRWAQKRLLPRSAGHKKGVETLKKIVNACFRANIKYISVYAFSTENQKRPQEERKALFDLIKEYFQKSINEFIDNKIRIMFMGDLSYFPQDVRDVLSAAVEKSKDFSEHVLNVGLNYGSRNEIVNAVNEAVRLKTEVTEESFSKLLYTSLLPDPDLIVRTSGEQRLSNFMLFQSAYSELIFTSSLWPDFNEKKLYQVLAEYSQRNRRFGKV